MNEALAKQPQVSVPAPTETQIDKIRNRLRALPQVHLPVDIRFSPGMMLKQMFVPKGTFIIGKRHKTQHLNQVIMGRANVMMMGGSDGPSLNQHRAGDVFESFAGCRKLVYAVEDTIFAVPHPNPTDETDLDKIEALLIDPADSIPDAELEAAKQQLLLHLK